MLSRRSETERVRHWRYWVLPCFWPAHQSSSLLFQALLTQFFQEEWVLVLLSVEVVVLHEEAVLLAEALQVGLRKLLLRLLLDQLLAPLLGLLLERPQAVVADLFQVGL